MNYVKPQIQVSCEALVLIQRTAKGSVSPMDSIDPNSTIHFLTQNAYEADE